MIEMIESPHAGLQSAFEALESGSQPETVMRLRAEAFERFCALGWPTRKHEAWKYTAVTPIARAELRAVPQAANDEDLADRLEEAGVDRTAGCLVFVDGRFSSSLSTTPHGFTAESLSSSAESAMDSSVEEEQHAFVALNQALFADGARIHVPAKTRIDRPVELVFVQRSKDIASHPRVSIHLEREARLSVVQRHLDFGAGASLENSYTEITLDQAAELDHYVLVDGTPEAFHVGVQRYSVERDARLRLHTFAFGGALVRCEADVAFRAEGAEVDLGGLYVADEAEHVDCRTFIDHAVPHCASRQVYHGAIGGKGHGVFNGEVLVRTDAQKSEAHQTNRNLLLSDTAKADTKPQLEIFADDVKCSHGATIGQLDPDALFYLRSRALGEDEARMILTRAFAGTITDQARPLALQQTLEQLLATRLGGRDRRNQT